ncbi:phage tail protein [Pseudomonas rhizoryzae]|uniref:phage tail protein n=1 Tax=Pseudomonas rhizoryzae TaxID=2571129 RepID=UPI0007370B4C|nr:phage tail protein [Pseudomonas rhizoryzae]
MSQTYYAILTAIGEAKLANAAALNTTLKIAKMAVGDGGGAVPTPTRTQTVLVGEWYRAGLNTLSVDPSNTSQIIAELVIPEATGGNWIREMGLYDIDGNLIAVANTPPSYKPQLAEGSGRTQVLRMILVVSSTSAVELKIDPSVILATRQYVDTATQQASETVRGTAKVATEVDISAATDDTRFITSKKLAGWWGAAMKQASEITFGWTMLATQEQVSAGTNDATTVTPKKLASWWTSVMKQATESILGWAKLATQAQVNAGTDDATIVTPMKLRAGFSVSFGYVGYIALPAWLGGFILQWGSTVASNITSLTVTYPVAYPNACYGVWQCIYNDTVGSTDSVRRTTSGAPLTTATFRVTNADGGSSVGWLSIGR